MQPFKSISYAAVEPGTRLLVLGAVHGDEVCGTRAIERVTAEIDAGTLRLRAGRVTFVPVTNPLAYAKRRRAVAATLPDAHLDLDPAYGIGTTEYMRALGGWALTLECGRHDDPGAPDVAYRAIVRTLAHLGLSDAPDPEPAAAMETLRLS